MPFAAGMFCTTIAGPCGRYLPMKRATSRAPTSVTPPAVEPTIMRTVLPAKLASWACADTINPISARIVPVARMLFPGLRVRLELLDAALEERHHVGRRCDERGNQALDVFAPDELDRQSALARVVKKIRIVHHLGKAFAQNRQALARHARRRH